MPSRIRIQLIVVFTPIRIVVDRHRFVVDWHRYYAEPDPDPAYRRFHANPDPVFYFHAAVL
jgi:hypothetical protein